MEFPNLCGFETWQTSVAVLLSVDEGGLLCSRELLGFPEHGTCALVDRTQTMRPPAIQFSVPTASCPGASHAPCFIPPPETSSWRAKIFHTCPAPARWPGCLPSGQSGLCEATIVLESSSVACWTFVWTALGRLISRALPAAAVDASRVSSFSLLHEPQKQERASTPHSAGTK